MKKMLSLILVAAMLMMTATTAFADPSSPFSIFGDDDRVPVTSTSGKNYSICKIKTVYSDDSVGYGTGFLISSTKVVTAGHNVHYKTKAGKPKTAKSLVLYFGCSKNGTVKETVSFDCTADNLYYPSGWADNYDADLDYAAIKLPKAVKGPTEYFTLSDSNDNLDDKTITMIGYEHHNYSIPPVYTNWTLLETSGKVIGSTTWRLYTRLDGMPGQSGSPVLYGGKVVALYTYSVNGSENHDPPYQYGDDDENFNQCTRITKSASTALKNF